jgi:hypothetical protein
MIRRVAGATRDAWVVIRGPIASARLANKAQSSSWPAHRMSCDAGSDLVVMIALAVRASSRDL